MYFVHPRTEWVQFAVWKIGIALVTGHSFQYPLLLWSVLSPRCDQRGKVVLFPHVSWVLEQGSSVLQHVVWLGQGRRHSQECTSLGGGDRLVHFSSDGQGGLPGQEVASELLWVTGGGDLESWTWRRAQFKLRAYHLARKGLWLEWSEPAQGCSQPSFYPIFVWLRPPTLPFSETSAPQIAVYILYLCFTQKKELRFLPSNSFAPSWGRSGPLRTQD